MRGRHAAPPSPVRRAFGDLTHLLLPVSCAGCDAPDVGLCRWCRTALVGVPVVERTLGAGPPRDPPVPVVATVAYAGAARRILLQWKDDGRHDLVPVVRAALTRAVRAAVPVDPPRDGVLVVPVPSAAAASRRRGGDVLAEVTRGAVRALVDQGVPVRCAPVLRQRGRPLDQAGLGVDERRRNLAGALVVRPGHDLRGRTVVLVDDVVTTGATLADGVRALRLAGAVVTAAAVVAATGRIRTDTGPRPDERACY